MKACASFFLSTARIDKVIDNKEYMEIEHFEFGFGFGILGREGDGRRYIDN